MQCSAIVFKYCEDFNALHENKVHESLLVYRVKYY